MWCSKCNKHLAECECPDIEERLARLAKIPEVSIAAKQNMLDRRARKEQVKPENN
jgi:hypothetical protein